MIAVLMCSTALAKPAATTDQTEPAKTNVRELERVASPEEIYQELVAVHGDVENSSMELSNSMLMFSNRRVPPVYVVVDKSEQRLHVWIHNEYRDSWKVSTGVNRRVCAPSGRCYYASTPTGTWRPKRMFRRYKSRLWGARMDYAIFIVGGIALHATGDTRNLGRPASGGCVRQSYRNARRLFEAVDYYGMNNTLVKIRN